MLSRDLLSERQKLMVDAIVEGTPIKEIAKMCNVTPKTIWLWRQIPVVKHFILQGLSDKHDVSGGQGTAVLPEVMARMKEIACSPLSDVRVSNMERIAAAKVIIAGAADYQNTKILERQLHMMETRLAKLSTSIKMEAESSLGLRSADPERQAEEEREEEDRELELFDVTKLSTDDLEAERQQLLLEQAAELLEVGEE